MFASNFYPSSNELQKEVGRMLSCFLPRNFEFMPKDFCETSKLPQFNVWRNEDKLVVVSEIPGFNPEKISIEIEGNVLTVGAERQPEQNDEFNYHRVERNVGNFKRSIKLPFNIDESSVVAEYKQGILRISLAQAQSDKPRKIQIKSN